MSIGLSAALSAAASTWASAATATSCGAPLVSTCIDDDNVWPHAGSSHFLTVGATNTLEAGQVGFGVVTSYLSRPLTLRAATPGPGGSIDDVIDNQVNSSFLWSYGVARRLELDVVLPVTFGQSGTGASPITGATSQTSLSRTAMRDMRFGLTYTFLARPPVDPAQHRADGFGLAGRFEMSAPTGDTGEFATNGTGVWAPGVAADYRYAQLLVGGEVGARIRPTQEFEGATIGSQAVVAVGASWDVLRNDMLTLGGEAFALPTFAEQHAVDGGVGIHGLASTPNGRYIAPAEWMLSARTAPIFGGAFEIQVAGGGPIPFSSDAVTNPRFRFSLSIRYAREWRDTDGDGVSDSEDKCPFVRGIADNPAGRGCPSSASTERVDLTSIPIEVPPVPVTPFTDPSKERSTRQAPPP
jgi:hypothetical protein